MKATTNQKPEVDQQRLVRCFWNNLRAVLICLPALGLLLMGVHEVGGYEGIERLISAAIGLSIGWIAGLRGALLVISSPNDQGHGSPGQTKNQ